MPLIMLSAGQGGTITRICGNDRLKSYLYSLGFAIGEYVSVTSKESAGLIVGIGASRLALDAVTASKIFV